MERTEQPIPPTSCSYETDRLHGSGAMVPLLLVLLLPLILFGAHFALKALWWIAVIMLVVNRAAPGLQRLRRRQNGPWRPQPRPARILLWGGEHRYQRKGRDRRGTSGHLNGASTVRPGHEGWIHGQPRRPAFVALSVGARPLTPCGSDALRRAGACAGMRGRCGPGTQCEHGGAIGGLGRMRGRHGTNADGHRGVRRGEERGRVWAAAGPVARRCGSQTGGC